MTMKFRIGLSWFFTIATAVSVFSLMMSPPESAGHHLFATAWTTGMVLFNGWMWSVIPSGTYEEPDLIE